MKKRGLILGIMFLLSVFTASAAVLDINTLPNHDVWITAKSPTNPEETIVQPMKFSSDSNGSLIITYEIYESFTLTTSVKDGNEYVVFTKGDEVYGRNDYVELDLFPEGYVAPVRAEPVLYEATTLTEEVVENETIEEVVEAETVESKSISLPNLSSFNEFVNTPYFYGGIALVLLVLLFVFRKRTIHKKIHCIDKKIERLEKRIDKCKEKKRGLVIKARENMIHQEESLIKFRGGSVPEKKKEKSMVERLKESLKKDGISEE